MKVGFLGMGNMGAPMAKNLLGAGHTAPGGNRPGWESGWTRMGYAVRLINEERLWGSLRRFFDGSVAEVLAELAELRHDVPVVRLVDQPREELLAHGEELLRERIGSATMSGQPLIREVRQLRSGANAGKLHDAAGIVIGRNVPDDDFVEAETRAAKSHSRIVKPLPRKLVGNREPLLDDVFAERLRRLGIPVLTGLPFGHIHDYATLPIGVKASMSTRTADLVIEEPAVV